MEAKHRHTVDMSWKIHRILNKFEQLESAVIHLASGKSITHRELHAIQAVGEIENINITMLGVHFGVTKSAASQLVSKLVKRGLVTKSLSAHSGKELQLSLTEAGWEAYELHHQYHSKNIREISKRLDSFTVAQILTTSNILSVVEAVISERLNQD